MGQQNNTFHRKAQEGFNVESLALKAGSGKRSGRSCEPQQRVRFPKVLPDGRAARARVAPNREALPSGRNPAVRGRREASTKDCQKKVYR